MSYAKLALISEGKTKRLWATDSDAHAIAEFSDDAMMYHAKKKLYFKNKGYQATFMRGKIMRADNYIIHDNLENKIILDKLLKVSETKGPDKVSLNFQGNNVYLYYDGTSNKQQELDKLYKEKERIELSIQRREKLLSNENYVNKAPKEIVESEKDQLAKEKRELENIESKLKQKN